MKNEDIYCEIYAYHFEEEYEKLVTKYRILVCENFYDLESKTILPYPTITTVEDWKRIDVFQYPSQAIMKIFKDLRQVEIDRDLYADLKDTEIPESIYQRKVEQFVSHCNLRGSHGMSDRAVFDVYGNADKYKSSSGELIRKDFLEMYKKGMFSRDFFSFNVLYLQQLIKHEITLLNANKINELKEVSVEDYLRGSYLDYQKEIDFYVIDNKISDGIKVNESNKSEVVANFLSYNVMDYTYDYKSRTQSR